MVLSREMLKANAKARLAGNWGGAILAILLPGIVSYVVSMVISQVTGIAGFYGMADSFYGMDEYAVLSMLGGMSMFYLLTIASSFLLAVPLSYGSSYWFYKIVRGQQAGIGDIFHFFTSGKRYGKALLLSLNIGIRTFGWSMLLVAIPTVLMTLAMVAESTAFLGLSVVLFIACMIGLMFVTFRYVVGFVQICDNEEIGTSEAIRRSILATKGHLGDMFVMELSFIGWMMLCMFVFPMFYVMPYYTMTLTEQYCNLADAAFGSPANTAGGYPPNGYGQPGYDPMAQQPPYQQPPYQQPPYQQPPYNNGGMDGQNGYTAPPQMQQPPQQPQQDFWNTQQPGFSEQPPAAPNPPTMGEVESQMKAQEAVEQDLVSTMNQVLENKAAPVTEAVEPVTEAVEEVTAPVAETTASIVEDVKEQIEEEKPTEQ